MAKSNIAGRVLALARYAITGEANDWFGPLQPMQPIAPANVAGRQFDYQVGANLNYRPRAEEAISFEKLKSLAKYDVVRIIMDGQKDKLEALNWRIKPREEGGRKAKADRSILDIQAMLEYPDRRNDWAQWLRALLDQLFVLDAVSIYRRRDMGGRPYAFELLDGATVKVLLDQTGRRPVSPDPAYQQVLKGVPAVNYTADELLYYPQNVRADHAYGCSRIQQIVEIVETAINRLRSQKGYFTHGNASIGFFEAPLGTQPDQIQQVETMWNNLTTAQVENRQIAQFLPGGFKWNAIGTPPLQDEFDEWLARIICFTFSTSPTPFMKQQGLGQGSAKSDHDAAESAGLGNIMAYVRRVMNRILIEDFQRPDLEFAWDDQRLVDPLVKAQIEDIRLKNFTLFVNEARHDNGDDPIADDVDLIWSATGPVPLDRALEPPQPVVAPIDPNAVVVPVDAPVDEVTAKLAKAFDAEQALTDLLAVYLAAKGKEVAGQVSGALGLAKAAPMDDHSGRIDDAFDAVDWSDWSDLLKPVENALAGIAVAAGTDAVSEHGLFDQPVLDAMTADARAYAAERAAEMVGKKLVNGELIDNEGWSIPSATRDMIRGDVVTALKEGWSTQELAKSLRDNAAFGKVRAETIARTETATAQSEGHIAGWAATGLVAGKEWLADPDCCDLCLSLNGRIVPLQAEFIKGVRGRPAHPRCRCTTTAVLTEDMPKPVETAE